MKKAISCPTQSEFNKVLQSNKSPIKKLDTAQGFIEGEYEVEVTRVNNDGFDFEPEIKGTYVFSPSCGDTYKLPNSEWKQGDILMNEYGDEIKILGVCGEVYLVSDYDKFDIVESFQTKTQLKDWKLKTTEEITIAEAEKTLKDLGRDVKILK